MTTEFSILFGAIIGMLMLYVQMQKDIIDAKSEAEYLNSKLEKEIFNRLATSFINVIETRTKEVVILTKDSMPHMLTIANTRLISYADKIVELQAKSHIESTNIYKSYTQEFDKTSFWKRLLSGKPKFNVDKKRTKLWQSSQDEAMKIMKDFYKELTDVCNEMSLEHKKNQLGLILNHASKQASNIESLVDSVVNNPNNKKKTTTYH